ncbi:recombinase family protein [Shewanella zhangzhouensis]|uniref:recombinase family protein n=1 Tax=Shewanella zhangzhouensis TaxID=2864213 RepID=UPI001C65F259|nr:recombinase family protein [Shewanella zhangzhouensis]QYK04914.1 recombinase family protein [Shewanella zhangzhouensis]
MTTFAYIRVSDSTKQDSSNQRFTIEGYARELGLTVHNWREFNLSGSKTTAEARGIDELLSEVKAGDVVLVSDIARLGRDSIHQLLHTITSITTKGATLHLCYSKTTIAPEDVNDLPKVFIAIGEAFAAVRFAEERSQKAKVACERRKAAGLHNGRKHGAEVRSKLDDHAAFILRELEKGTAKTALIGLLKDMGVSVTRQGLYKWMERRLGNL